MEADIPDILDLAARFNTENHILILNRRSQIDAPREVVPEFQSRDIKLYTIDQLTPLSRPHLVRWLRPSRRRSGR